MAPEALTCRKIFCRTAEKKGRAKGSSAGNDTTTLLAIEVWMRPRDSARGNKEHSCLVRSFKAGRDSSRHPISSLTSLSPCAILFVFSNAHLCNSSSAGLRQEGQFDQGFWHGPWKEYDRNRIYRSTARPSAPQVHADGPLCATSPRRFSKDRKRRRNFTTEHKPQNRLPPGYN